MSVVHARPSAQGCPPYAGCYGRRYPNRARLPISHIANDDPGGASPLVALGGLEPAQLAQSRSWWDLGNSVAVIRTPQRSNGFDQSLIGEVRYGRGRCDDQPVEQALLRDTGPATSVWFRSTSSPRRVTLSWALAASL